MLRLSEKHNIDLKWYVQVTSLNLKDCDGLIWLFIFIFAWFAMGVDLNDDS